MAKPPTAPLDAPATREEKFSILSALLGPDTLARLREKQLEAPLSSPAAPVSVDEDRAAWHRNKLLERLRLQGRTAREPGGKTETGAAAHRTPQPPVSGATKPRDKMQSAPSPSGGSLDMRIAAVATLDTLANEHPAIITRLLRNLPRNERVAVLRSLPGPLARSVVKRLR